MWESKSLDKSITAKELVPIVLAYVTSRVANQSLLEKWFPLQSERAHPLKFFVFEKSISIQIQSKSFIALLSSSVSRANLSCVVATIFSSLAFLSSSVSMANLSRLVAASFSSLPLLSFSVSTANLICLLVTTFSSLSFLSNSFSSPRFNLLRVARRCFSWSSVSDDLLFSSCSFFCSPSCSIFSRIILSLSFQSLKLCLL